MRLEYETKKKPNINWSDKTSQNILINQLLTDDQTICDILADIEDTLEPDFKEVVRLLDQITDQEVEQTESGKMVIKNGVAKDQIVSVVDPEMLPRHKSRYRKIYGHKISLTADLESEFITML